MTPPFARLMALVVLAAMALLSGCTRGPSSKYINVPEDPERQQFLAEVSRISSSPDLVLGKTDDYAIGPGDVLKITIVGRNDLFGTTDNPDNSLLVTVTDNPALTLPLIGAIRAHGRTAAELQAELSRAYAQFISKPTIIVTVDKFFSNQVAVLGAVKTPGRYPIEFGDTVVDAIFKAGGMTFGGTSGPPPARVLKVYREKVTRRERQNMSLDELLTQIKEGDRILPREEIVIPLEEFIVAGQLNYNIPLNANDIVYIPPAGAVSVQGRVKTPGATFLGPSIRSVTQVLTERGGLRYGAASRIEVVRIDKDGRVQSFYRNARRMLSRQEEDFMLQDNDQVFVYTHPVRAVLEAIGDIFKASANTGVNATYAPI